jgi:peptide/nickel transport system substrate-binding protein
MSSPQYSRRDFLRMAAFTAGGTIAVSMLQACVPAQPPAPVGSATTPAAEGTTVAAGGDADTLVIGLPQTQRTDEFDASQVFEFQTKIFAFCVSESLVLYDFLDQKYTPRLAESWEIADDLTSITFKLRQGVTFHDGTPFNADAVVFSFERIFKPDNEYAKDGTFYYNTLVPFYKVTEKVDDYTAKVTFTQADSLILQRFAIDTSYIANPKGVMAYGNRDYSTDPTKYSGTGPYKVVELRPKELVRLERNEDWWGETKPAFKNLIFRLFTNDTAGGDARVNALLAKELDLALYLPGTRRNDVANVDGLKVEWFPQAVLGYYYLNHTDPFFKDKLVRQAIARSFDRKTFFEATVGPTTVPWGGFWYPDSPYYNPDAHVDYDVDKANALLDQAGFTDKGGDGIRVRPADGMRAAFKFQWAGLANAQPPDDRVFWSQQLQKLFGVEAKLEAYDPGLSADFKAGPLAPDHLGIYGWGVGTFLADPEFAYNRWTCAERTPAGFNASQYCNDDLDALYAQSKGAKDEGARIEIFKEMQAIAAEDIPWIPSSIATMGGAWWTNKVSNVTAGATQYSYPWTYQLPAA